MQTLSADNSEQLAKFRSALLASGGEMTLPTLATLVTVAIEPGISVNDLANRIGVPQQSASRYVSVLLGRYQSLHDQSHKAAFISQEVNIEEPRKRALFLTPVGKEFVANIIDSLHGMEG